MASSRSKSTRILYMEDDPGLARLVQRKLERRGYVVTITSDGAEGIAMYEAGSYDVVAVDQEMPAYSGLEVIRQLVSRDQPSPPIVMITGNGNEQIAVEAMKRGASDYIVKDVEGGYLDLLPTVIERVLDQQRLREEKQEAEDALRQYAAELEARNEELDAFAHTVAHDLKGALGSIVGYAQTLVEDHTLLTTSDLHRYLQTIAKSGRRMSNIIDELLLLASVRKVEDVEIVLLDMERIVEEALERLGYLIEKYQAQIVLPEAWPRVWGYGPWVEEVWVNYISNAIKYGGKPPYVELGVSPLAPHKGGGTGGTRFWVRDNGEGLTPEEQARLFTPFTRLDQVRAKGYGLGLSIVRRIVDKLGGEVGIESEVGRGSTFWFVLPGAVESD